MEKKNIRILILMHLMFMIYSMSGICSKMAALQDFLSFQFCVYYALIVVILGLYAVGWQQIIKKLPLTVAFANKAVTVIWGTIWGIIIFGEDLTIGKMVGIIFIVFGVILFAYSNQEGQDEKK